MRLRDYQYSVLTSICEKINQDFGSKTKLEKLKSTLKESKQSPRVNNAFNIPYSCHSGLRSGLRSWGRWSPLLTMTPGFLHRLAEVLEHPIGW